MKRRWGWMGYTLRKPDDNTTRQVLSWNPEENVRGANQRNTWRRDFEVDIERKDKNWREMEVILKNMEGSGRILSTAGTRKGSRQYVSIQLNTYN